MSPDEATGAQFAGALLGGALRLKRGEDVIIETWNHTLPYATACVVEARRIGAHPILWVEDEAAYWRSLDVAPSVSKWGGVGRHEWKALAETDGYVFFPGPADRGRFRSLPNSTRGALVGYNDEWYRRARASGLRGVRSIVGYASDAQAALWGVPGTTWREQLVTATAEADLKQIQHDAARISGKLRAGKQLRVTGANGSDLTMKLRGREPWSDDGVVGPDDLKAGRNMTNAPPGSVVVAVDERSAEGLAVANRPSFVPDGRLEGGQWEVKAGHLANAWYTEGQSSFETTYQQAPKGKDVLSFFSLGLNAALAPGVAQVEDQEGGAVALGIGGNQYYGGSNRCPFVSWIVLGEATVAIDGKPLVDRGKLL
ncbi:MAG: aminopeptidase [Thermoplasmata archaeon]|nr:aminopeptidase [Thermoplasmata archaeon]